MLPGQETGKLVQSGWISCFCMGVSSAHKFHYTIAGDYGNNILNVTLKISSHVTQTPEFLVFR